MNEFLDEFAAASAAAAQQLGVDIDAPSLDADLAQEILELARIAAHASERRFAPLVSFMAGMAAERYVRSGGGDMVSFLHAARETIG